jgi:PTS system ascorbate-specific IIA component
MLSDLMDEKLIRLGVEASDWEDAVRKAAQPLVDEGKVTPAYVDDIIKGVNELGPYIVLTEHVALPHARPESGALESAIGVVTLKTPVEFGSAANDPVKYLFPLSAKDNDSHLAALQSLVEFLSKPEFFSMLDSASSPREIIDYVRKEEKGIDNG